MFSFAEQQPGGAGHLLLHAVESGGQSLCAFLREA